MAPKSCLVIRHVNFEGLGLLAHLLREHEYEYRYSDAASDEVCCEEVERHDLVIVLGGPFGVYEADKYPFIQKEIDCIRKRLESERPILGICLGAQMMAAAMGAKVASSGGKEIGWREVTLTNEGRNSFLAPLEGQPILHWHGDNCELPSGCTCLAYNDFCPVQAFQRTPVQLGLQFHMEVEADRIERWIVSSEEGLRIAGLAGDDIRAQAKKHGAAAYETGNRIFNDWFKSLEAVP